MKVISVNCFASKIDVSFRKLLGERGVPDIANYPKKATSKKKRLLKASSRAQMAFRRAQ